MIRMRQFNDKSTFKIINSKARAWRQLEECAVAKFRDILATFGKKQLIFLI